MPPLLIYALLVLAMSTVAGFGFALGGATASFLSMIGLVVVVVALWQPLIKPLIEKMTKK